MSIELNSLRVVVVSIFLFLSPRNLGFQIGHELVAVTKQPRFLLVH